MRAGDLCKRIMLMFPTGATDSDSGELLYTDGSSVWAAFDVRPPAGAAVRINNLEQPIQTRWVKIRPCSIQSNWRVRYNNQVYEVISPPIDTKMSHDEMFLELKVIP